MLHCYNSLCYYFLLTSGWYSKFAMDSRNTNGLIFKVKLLNVISYLIDRLGEEQ
jgi:hypothetical protein